MRKVMIGFMIVCLGVILSLSMNQVKAKDLDANKGKMYDMFDKLYEKDRLESQGVLVIDSINDGNEFIEIDGIKYDKEVFYSSLFYENKEGKVKEKILKYKESNNGARNDSLDRLNYMLDLCKSDQMSFYEIIDFIKENEMVKEYKNFYKDLIPKDRIKDDRLIELQTSYSYETVSMIYYEDYDSTKTIAGYFEKQLEYYGPENNKIYTGIVRYVMAYPLNSYIEYNHQSSVGFIYDVDGDGIISGARRPEAEIYLIIDYLGEQKMIVVDTDGDESPYKITQDMHYNRNQYNVLETSSNNYSPVNQLSYSQLNSFGFSSTNSNYFHELLVPDNFSREKWLLSVEYYDNQLGDYMHGSLEAIIIDKSNGVYDHDTSSLRMGTFNLGVDESELSGTEAHYFRDVYPYLVWGNEHLDYLTHIPHERFIWDKGSRYNKTEFKDKSGIILIDFYYDNAYDDSTGEPIPETIKNANLYLDFSAPTIIEDSVKKYITEGVYINLDWSERVYLWDDYTLYDEIVACEYFDDVNYDVPGLYRVGIEAIDLAGNKTRKEIDVIVEAKVASC